MAFHTHKFKQYTPYDTVEACCGGGGGIVFNSHPKQDTAAHPKRDKVSHHEVWCKEESTIPKDGSKSFEGRGLKCLFVRAFVLYADGTIGVGHEVVRAIHAILRRLGFLLVGLFASVVQIGSQAFAPQLRALLGGRRTMRC